MKPKKKLIASESRDKKPLDPTSSLNPYFLCNCGNKYQTRQRLVTHLETCNGIKKSLICEWCNIEFRNLGNLVNHRNYMHGTGYQAKLKEKLEKLESDEYKCNVCDAQFSQKTPLIYHIRKSHFNLKYYTPHCEGKQINQTWFEKVLNTNLVMEIKKTGASTLVMKPSLPDPAVKILDTNKGIDLSFLYPTGRGTTKEKCQFCPKVLYTAFMKKHIDEKHSNLVKVKCNNCNEVFKRVYIYLKHVCNGKHKPRRPKVGGVKQYSGIHITSVASLKPIEVD